MHASAPLRTNPGLGDIQALARDDMTAVDALIRRRLASDVLLINQVSEYIINAGGKRLRPMLLLLAAGALGHRGADAHQLAAVVEFIHTATLLHDDVVDESDLRRGRKTANAVWGNAASVLVGDFLYSRSFQLMVELERMPVMQILADTTNQIAEGEALQLLHVRNPASAAARPAPGPPPRGRAGGRPRGGPPPPPLRARCWPLPPPPPRDGRTTTACPGGMPPTPPTARPITNRPPKRWGRTSATSWPK